jgi:hypothetical protein
VKGQAFYLFSRNALGAIDSHPRPVKSNNTLGPSHLSIGPTHRALKSDLRGRSLRVCMSARPISAAKAVLDEICAPASSAAAAEVAVRRLSMVGSG